MMSSSSTNVDEEEERTSMATFWIGPQDREDEIPDPYYRRAFAFFVLSMLVSVFMAVWGAIQHTASYERGIWLMGTSMIAFVAQRFIVGDPMWTVMWLGAFVHAFSFMQTHRKRPWHPLVAIVVSLLVGGWYAWIAAVGDKTSESQTSFADYVAFQTFRAPPLDSPRTSTSSSGADFSPINSEPEFSGFVASGKQWGVGRDDDGEPRTLWTPRFIGVVLGLWSLFTIVVYARYRPKLVPPTFPDAIRTQNEWNRIIRSDERKKKNLWKR